MKLTLALALLPLLVACSSTSAPDSGGDQSTGTYQVSATEAAERARTYLQSNRFRMKFTDEGERHLQGFLSTRRSMDRIDIEVAAREVAGGPGLTQVTVTGRSAGGDGVVRQWQMRVHRHLRALYPAPESQ